MKWIPNPDETEQFLLKKCLFGLGDLLEKRCFYWHGSLSAAKFLYSSLSRTML